jgi:hypothetical protein
MVIIVEEEYDYRNIFGFKIIFTRICYLYKPLPLQESSSEQSFLQFLYIGLLIHTTKKSKKRAYILNEYMFASPENKKHR